MQKNIYLTPQEQNIHRLLRKDAGSIITTARLKDLYPGQNTQSINKLCFSMAKKGYLYRIKKSAYLIHDEPSKKIIIHDPFKIATQLHTGYIAFSSALRIYDLIEYEPFTIFIATKKTSKNITLGQYQLKYIAMHRRAEGITYYNSHYISTKTKTFFDCFCKPCYADYSITTKALYTNKGCDWKQLNYYFEKFASSSLCQRTGYVLDLLQKETGMNIPKSTITYFRQRIKTKTRLYPTNPQAGKYISEWKIMDNIGKKSILSWWCDG